MRKYTTLINLRDKESSLDHYSGFKFEYDCKTNAFKHTKEGLHFLFGFLKKGIERKKVLNNISTKLVNTEYNNTEK